MPNDHGILSDDVRTHVSFCPTPQVQELVRQLPGSATWARSASGQPRAELLADVSGATALVCLLTDRIDDEVLDAAGAQIRVVANVAVGYDNVDVEACSRRGVTVTNTPGVLDEATADLTFALILATARRVVEADAFIRRGERWSWRPDLFIGVDVSRGATLGIIGLGKVGLAVARRALAFRMRVVATPSRTAAPQVAELGIETLPFRELLIESDVVSLHCPLTQRTHHLIGKEELRLMGPGSILINTARGAVVDESALVAALQAGDIRAAGLDVYEREPEIPAALLELPNVVLLPHIGSAGDRTRHEMAALAVRNVQAMLSGRAPLSAVGPG